MANSGDDVSPKKSLAVAAHEPPQGVPADIRELLGPAPITSLENGDAYERILSSIADAVGPKDFVEWTWVKDVVDLTWDAARARRAKAVRLALARRRAIENILEADLATETDSDLDSFAPTERRVWVVSFADRIFRRDGSPQKIENDNKVLGEILARLGLTEESLNDEALRVALGDVERLQTLVDHANARRDATLREIDRRRDSLARRLREAVVSSGEIVDAEFENVPGAG